MIIVFICLFHDAKVQKIWVSERKESLFSFLSVAILSKRMKREPRNLEEKWICTNFAGRKLLLFITVTLHYDKELPASANIIVDWGNGESTAIESVNSTDGTDGTWYTLTGIQLEGEPTAPGIYVKDGKKVAIQ